MSHRKEFTFGLFLISIIFALFITPSLIAQPCPDDALALHPAPLEESWAVEWWLPRHEAKRNEEGRESAKLLLLGDSITHGWESTGKSVWDQYFGDISSFNLGFSGDRTENVLWRLENGALEGISPELTVLMIGTNNTGHRQDSPECTTRGIEMILDQLLNELPESQILLLAIFPRGHEPDHELRQLNNEINERISHFSTNPKVHFYDINQIFLTDDGYLTEEIMPDMLHPNERGYQLWAKEIKPIINDILND
tara:strand:- start:138 stop:896 length:759 start_codon:yes stop_codon:yes gene_type:complete